jgi:DNA-binding MarR family transcriptional regulator
MKQNALLQDNERRQKWMDFMQAFHPNINPQTLQLMDQFGFVSRSLLHMREQSVEEAGLSFAQYHVLLHLFFAEQVGGRSELNPSEISERQGVTRNTMSAFIRNLEENELVERRLDPADRRRFNISLTANGRALVSQYAHEHLETLVQCFSALSLAEQANLFDLLKKLGNHVTAVRQQT